MATDKSLSAVEPHAIRILFVPDKSVATDSQLKRVYNLIKGVSYDTVVLLETRLTDTNRKIPMPSLSEFSAGRYTVPVNDLLRNEFCDEDDDFFIDDTALGEDMEVYRHLPYLCEVLDDFQIVSVPVCDEDPAIVREIDYVLSEIMNGRNMLLVVACSVPFSDVSMDIVRDMIQNYDISTIMNRVNSGECRVHGAPSFIAGIMIARSWELDISFDEPKSETESAVAGAGYLQVKTSAG